MSVVPTLQRACLGLFLTSIALQVYAAGLGLFGVASFMPHAILGYLMVLGALILLALTALARLPRRAIGLTGVIVVLAILQPVLVLQFRGSLPVVAALHPMNAILMFALAFWIARLNKPALKASALSGAAQ